MSKMTIIVHESKMTAAMARAILNGSAEGDKEDARRNLNRLYSEWVVKFKTKDGSPYTMKIVGAEDEADAWKQAVAYAERNGNGGKIDKTAPLSIDYIQKWESVKNPSLKIRVHEATVNSEKFKDLDAMCADVSKPTGIPGLDSIIRVDHLVRKDGETKYEPPFYLRLGKKWYAFDDRVYIDQQELCEYVNKVLDRYMLSNYNDIAPTQVREFKKCSSKVRSALFNLYSNVDNKYMVYRRAYLYKNQVYIELGMYWSDTIILKSNGSSKWQGNVLRCYGIAITGGNDEIIETERLTDNSNTHSMDNLINAIDSRMSNLPIVQGTLYDYGNFAQVGWWSTRNYKYDTIAPKVKALAQTWNTRIKDKYPDIADSLYVKTLNNDSSLYIKYLVPEEVLKDLMSAFEPLAVDLQGSDPTYVKV